MACGRARLDDSGVDCGVNRRTRRQRRAQMAAAGRRPISACGVGKTRCDNDCRRLHFQQDKTSAATQSFVGAGGDYRLDVRADGAGAGHGHGLHNLGHTDVDAGDFGAG